ncbi:MAG: nitrilase-related carbon-nitrogen hydrolase [Patescibacteria group bacterium]
MSKKLVLFVRKHWIFLSFLAYSAFCWSWVLEIDLARLASSSLAGKMMQITVLLVVTLMSAGIYTKSLKCLFAGIKKTKAQVVPFKLIMWWAATELFVAWVVCIIWYGVGGKFDNILPFTSLSHFAIWTPLGNLSRFVGFHGLSGVVFMLLVTSIRSDLRKFLVPAIFVVVVATLLAWGIYRIPSGPKVNVVVVSEHGQQEKLADTLKPQNGSMVVFPEYSFTGLDDEFINTKIKPQNPNETVYFVGSRFVYEPGKIKNQLVAGDTNSGYIYKIDKSRLIPGGEYLPYITVALFKIIGADGALDDFRAKRQIDKANGTPIQAPLVLGDMKVGAGICSSIIAPEDYRKQARDGANIFTNSAYLGIFNNSKVYGWQHRAMAKFMAIANARTFLQSASSGPAFGFDGNGRQLFYKEDTGITELSVSLNNRRTLYSFLGEYLGVAGLVWMLADFVRSRRNKT